MLLPGQVGKEKKRPCGSLNYAASEIVRNKSYTGPEVDIFSLGGVLYTMLTGRLPFGNSGNRQTVQRVIAGNWKVDYSLPQDVITFLDHMFEPVALKRATMLDVIQFVKKQKQKYCNGGNVQKKEEIIIENNDNNMLMICQQLQDKKVNGIQELVKLAGSSRAFVYTQSCAQEENEKTSLLLRSEAEANQVLVMPLEKQA